MEAKDTVMTQKQRNKVWSSRRVQDAEDVDREYIIFLTEAQAEISFEAGKQEERKGMLAWLLKHGSQLQIDLFKKEWGINEPALKAGFGD